MKLYLPVLLLMGLLTIGSVSSTDYLYAYELGEPGYLDTQYDKDVTVNVYKTKDLWWDTKESNVKFSVKKGTRCRGIAIVDYDIGAALEIVIDDGPHKGETGWVNFDDFWEY
ncbi:MAG: hypothetical protein GY800_12590 [Planctomycetes bacterium]|nr:hypothetical protein [Planctomycetota bacterium]